MNEICLYDANPPTHHNTPARKYAILTLPEKYCLYSSTYVPRELCWTLLHCFSAGHDHNVLSVRNPLLNCHWVSSQLFHTRRFDECSPLSTPVTEHHIVPLVLSRWESARVGVFTAAAVQRGEERSRECRLQRDVRRKISP